MLIGQSQMKKEITPFNVGDVVNVVVKIPEQDKIRLHSFEGTVICKRQRGIGSTFTVRKVSYGEGIERIFPLHSPSIEKIEVVRRGKVRRAKLYYLRKKIGKEAKVKTIDQV